MEHGIVSLLGTEGEDEDERKALVTREPGGLESAVAAKKVARSEETNSEDEIDILGVSDDSEDQGHTEQVPEEGTPRVRVTRA
jgi:hypothetical protein